MNKNPIKREVRDKVLESSEGYCILAGPNCTVFATTVDHWIPRVKGGGNQLHNLRPACSRCNTDKGGMHPAEWELFVFNRPLWEKRKPRPKKTWKMSPAEEDTYRKYGVKPWESFNP